MWNPLAAFTVSVRSVEVASWESYTSVTSHVVGCMALWMTVSEVVGNSAMLKAGSGDTRSWLLALSSREKDLSTLAVLCGDGAYAKLLRHMKGVTQGRLHGGDSLANVGLEHTMTGSVEDLFRWVLVRVERLPARCVLREDSEPNGVSEQVAGGSSSSFCW